MAELRYTLLSDGSGDRALMPILRWLLREHLGLWAIQEAWADLRRLPRPPKRLAERISQSIDLYPCDLLFVHRDAENQSPALRVREISQAIAAVRRAGSSVRHVPVIPVRMHEAWLLFDESALRQAAGNPHGREALALPHLNELERLPNPKADLHDLLRKASGRAKRRLKTFDVPFAASQIPNHVLDFSPLRALAAFRRLEDDLVQVLRNQEWATS